MKKNWPSIIAVILLLGQLAFQLYMAKTDAQTTDEGVHLSAGFTYLTKRDFRFNPEHPPFLKELATLPLLFIHPNIPEDQKYWDKAADFYYDSWRENRAFGDEMLYALGNNADLLLFWGRLAPVLITFLLGLAVFLISKRFFGSLGGLISTVFFVLDSLINGHGHLITTDIAVSLGILLSIYFLYRLLETRRMLFGILFGVSAGLALASKHTAVMLIPISLVLIIVYQIWFSEGKRARSLILPIIAAIFLSFILIWASYGFTYRLPPKINSVQQIFKSNIPLYKTESFNEQKQGFTGTKDKMTTIVLNAARRVLFPQDYYKGLVSLLIHAGSGHSSFLLGETSITGWWYYFPVVFAAKTPIPELIGLVAAVWLIIRRKNKPAIFFLLAALLYLLLAMVSKADLGLRHLMPIYPVIFISLGVLANLKGLWKLLPIALVAFSIFEFITAYPYHLSYFNAAVGGTNNGYRIAADSNLDWGQDLKRIKAYLDESNLGNNVFVEYGWNSELALDYYGIKRKPLSELTPDSSGYVVIGSSALQSDAYKWLRDGFEPIARITPSVFLFQI